MISVLILTRNEARDLPGCLASVAWCDDVHVLDSCSTDETRAIAEAAGAHVVQRPFDDYASQRNVGLALPLRHAWVLTLDADERTPPALVEEMRRFVAAAAPSVAAARLRRRDFWQGRWLRHAQISPYYLRLVRVGRARYERAVNEVLVVDGETAELAEPFDHHPFSKGLDHWIDKHNAYSRREAAIGVQGELPEASWRVALLGRDFNQRRMHQKALFFRLPGRPLLKFLYMMVVRRAFLDGRPGVQYAVLQCLYETMIVLKQDEIRRDRPPREGAAGRDSASQPGQPPAAATPPADALALSAARGSADAPPRPR